MEEINTKIESLLSEYGEQRTALKEMVKELELVKAKIDKLFPDSIDKRYLYAFEQKVKSATELFKAILEMRKEISKNIKDEIEIRRKLGEGGTEEEEMNIGRLAKRVEELMPKQQKEKIIALKGIEHAG